MKWLLRSESHEVELSGASHLSMAMLVGLIESDQLYAHESRIGQDILSIPKKSSMKCIDTWFTMHFNAPMAECIESEGYLSVIALLEQIVGTDEPTLGENDIVDAAYKLLHELQM
ncbi:hypothetical protein P7M17_11220 [Vibrio parahaemolyticus]|nr:hypothetical protein [Vibrio parahaemolyticus]